MKKSISKLSMTLVTLGALATPLVNTSSVYAAEVNSNSDFSDNKVTNKNSDNNKISISNNDTNSEFDVMDKYVIVKNNRYVLDIPKNNQLSEESVDNVKQQLILANKTIQKQKLTIDPTTKTATIFAVSTRGDSAQNVMYYWGLRTIYRSNAAVNYRVKLYSNYSSLTAVAGGAAGILGVGIAGILASTSFSVASATTEGWARQLESFNNLHRKSKIYQDINWALQSSVGIYK